MKDYPEQTPRQLLNSVARANGPASLLAIRELRHFLDLVETEIVRSLRRDGLSWDAIADDLGVTRQAAQQRWAARV